MLTIYFVGDSAIPTLSPEDQQLVEQKLRSVQIEMRQPVAISSTEIQVNWQVRQNTIKNLALRLHVIIPEICL